MRGLPSGAYSEQRGGGMATVTPKPRAAEDPAATGLVAAAGGSAGSAVRRSIHRAMDRYFGVPNAGEPLES